MPIHGSVELAPRLDAAEAIADLVSSGETLRQNGLRPIATVLESEAVLLVAARPRRPRSGASPTTWRTVMESIIAARDKRYLMLNAHDDALEPVVELLPGLDSPTVLPLARSGMHAVHAVVDRRQVVELLGPLREAGARAHPRPADREPGSMSGDPVSAPSWPRPEPYRWQEGLPADRPLMRFDMNTQPAPPAWYAGDRRPAGPNAGARSIPTPPTAGCARRSPSYTGFPREQDHAHGRRRRGAVAVRAAGAAAAAIAPTSKRPYYSWYESVTRLAGATLTDRPDGRHG